MISLVFDTYKTETNMGSKAQTSKTEINLNSNQVKFRLNSFKNVSTLMTLIFYMQEHNFILLSKIPFSKKMQQTLLYVFNITALKISGCTTKNITFDDTRSSLCDVTMRWP
jgi:hypothetical protein